MRTHWSIVLLVLAIGCSWTDKASHHPNTHRGIALQTDAPRGGVYADTSGKEFEYRIFRVHVKNDSTVPAELAMDFPGGPIALLPDTDKYISVFLFPDDISPDTAQDVFNYGITGSEDYVRTRPSGPTSLRTTVLPGEAHILYIGVVFSPEGLDGLGRAQLFIGGQKPDPSFFPEGSVPTGTQKGNELDLTFGISIDPPEHYSMVPCGRIAFEK
ncbi:MAG: hypothetical protein JNM31_07385 [Flavobacteriales bacterium]|nr:hypothetical protein [Flavobacteriales bacterium]